MRSVPPNRTVAVLTGSYAMAAPDRAVGLVAGCRTVHVRPSQIHVSPNSVFPLPPPKRRVTRRLTSNDIAAATLAGGRPPSPVQDVRGGAPADEDDALWLKTQKPTPMTSAVKRSGPSDLRKRSITFGEVSA